MSRAPLHVISAGSASSVGLSRAATSAALRAGLDRFQTTHFLDERAQPIVGAPIDLPLESEQNNRRTGGSSRAAHLLSLVLEECLDDANIPLPIATDIPLLVLGDDTRQNNLIDTTHATLKRCDHLIDHDQNHPRIVRAFMQGDVACVYALDAAREYLDNGAPYVLIAAVDSWLNVPDIVTTLSQHRLLTSDNAAGFIPGEGASAILLSNRLNQTGAQTKQTSLSIMGLGADHEEALLLDQAPCYGVGLAQAIKKSLTQANWPLHTINMRLSNVSGEEYFFQEAAYAWARLLRQSLPTGHQHLRLAENLGNIGHACGPLLIAHLWQLLNKQRLNAERILIHLSSAQADRGAIALHATP